MFKVTAYYWLKYHANKKIILGEVAKECYLTCKQKQLSETISIKIQLPLFRDQHSAVPLLVSPSFSLLVYYTSLHQESIFGLLIILLLPADSGFA